jgi:S1-C subfamily serine protease
MTLPTKQAISFTPFEGGLGPLTDKSKGVPLFGNTPLMQDLANGEREGFNDVHSRGYGEDVENHSYHEEGGEYRNQEALKKLDKDRAVGKGKGNRWVAEMEDGSRYEFKSEEVAKTQLKMIGKPYKRIFMKAASDLGLTQRVLESCVEVLSSSGGASGVGAAFCIDEGLFITCAHVIKPYEIGVMLNNDGFASDAVVEVTRDGNKVPASVVFIDVVKDIALIKADFPSNVLELAATSESYMVGDDVLVVGSPKGFENNASAGIIGGFDRTVFTHPGAAKHVFTDAKILPGNSGGPMVSMRDGKVVGMVEIIVGEGVAYGLNAAIEPEYLVKSVKEFRSGVRK